jgi:hypothetical protein
MMVQEYTSTCYVLFWIMVVPTSDPKDMFMERGTCNQFCGYSGQKDGMRLPGLRRWSGFIS